MLIQTCSMFTGQGRDSTTQAVIIFIITTTDLTQNYQFMFLLLKLLYEALGFFFSEAEKKVSILNHYLLLC